MTREEEAALVRAAQQQDGPEARRAFDALHHAFSRPLLGFLRVRAYTDADAEEIAQDTWTKFWKYIHSYDPAQSRLRTFLYSVAIRTLIDYYRAGQQIHIEDLAAEDPVALAEALLMRHVEAKDDSWAEELVELYDQFLWSAFDSRQNPPHQALAFGFVKLLEWRPAEVVRELSPMRLTELTDKLEESLGEIGVCPRERLTDILSRMRTTFPKALRAILRDPRTRDTWHHLLDRSVGGIRFEEFYTSANREANVVQWWDAVRKRIARDVARRGAKDRIRVRAVEAETALRTADLTAFLLQEYLDGALRADRETEVENKLGTCAGEVAASARRLVRLRIALDHWNARSLALARVRWAIARALEVAEQDGPAGLVPRFRAWKTRWEGRAQAVVRRIEDRVVPFRERDWPDILVPSGWRFAPVAAVRGRSPAGTPAGATLYDPSHPEIRLEFQQRRLQFLLPESTAAGLSSRPLVLLVDENGKQPPEILDLAVEAGRWTADFPAVCALSSLLVVEPLSASIAGKP